jgi:hypothetical protein
MGSELGLLAHLALLRPGSLLTGHAAKSYGHKGYEIKRVNLSRPLAGLPYFEFRIYARVARPSNAITISYYERISRPLVLMPTNNFS